MLIATLIALLFMGSGANWMLDGIDQLQDNLKSKISDDNVRKTALDVADKMEDTAKDYAKADSKDVKELISLIEQYDSSVTDIQEHMEASFQKRLEYQAKITALRFELKDKLSRDQWNKVFSGDNKK